MTTAPAAILNLVRLFEDNYGDYKKQNFNETQLRRQFVDPFFEHLGWDISNKHGYAEQYKEVIHEDSFRHNGQRKAPDYSFRIGRERKFFLETKKPFVEIDKDKAPAYQLRRYAWSSKLQLSVVTNFDQLSIYDTRIKPEKDDAAKVARVLHFRFDEYVRRWHELSGLLSKESVLRGAFDRFSSSKVSKKGTAPVDRDFLDTIEGWRLELAKEIYQHNKNLGEGELSFAVQSLIDRILFLRICEDKGIETYESLKGVSAKAHAYKQLLVKFGDAQRRYNSGLFHVLKEGANDVAYDSISHDLRVPDKVIANIIDDIYFPKSPYEFSVISSEILGSVYERFLGSVVTIDRGKVHVELKPDLKKAGGVYYTPSFIVSYMAKISLDSLLIKYKGNELPKFRILDIACGSGSFLIEAYDRLLSWFLEWHIGRGRKSARYLDRIQLANGKPELRLKFSERRRILLEHIYGVDIDPHAVEVTKLSLFLKLIEDTSVMPAQFELAPFQKRLLPDMATNVKCGNSLVSTDVALNLTPDELEQTKPFDWYSEAGFKSVMTQGGFDLIIGNPPYSYRKSTIDKFKSYYTEKFETTEGNFDTYKMFLEQGAKLLKGGGTICQIVNSSFLIQPQFEKLRKFLDREIAFSEIDVLGSDVFPDVTIDTAILCGQRRSKGLKGRLVVKEPSKPEAVASSASMQISQSRFHSNARYVFDWRLSDTEAKVVNRLFSEFQRLDEVCDLSVGINTGSMKDEMTSGRKVDGRYHPCVPGNGISRYGQCETDGWIAYDPTMIKAAGSKGRTLPPESFFSSEKILIVRTRNTSLRRRIISTIDSKKYYNLNRLSNVVPKVGTDIKTILGIMNSEIWNYLFLTRYFNYEIKPVYLKDAPVPVKSDEKLSAMVTQRIKLEEALKVASLATKKAALVTAINTSELAIDNYVYKLFGINSAEKIQIKARLMELPGK
jgi:hypothetical protein